MNTAQITVKLVATTPSRETQALRAQRAPPHGRPWPAPVTLPKGAIHRIERPEGSAVACVGGVVWLTHDGDPRDITLVAGERHVVDRASRLLVQALEPAVIRVDPVAAADGPVARR